MSLSASETSLVGHNKDDDDNDDDDDDDVNGGDFHESDIDVGDDDTPN